MYCQYCKEIKNIYGLKNHELYCNMNPDKRNKSGENNPMFGRKGSNQYEYAKRTGSNVPAMSDLTKEKISDRNKGRNHSEISRSRISESMKKAVVNNPDSYSANNVSGRTKILEYKGFKLKGKWELEVAKWLDFNQINWTNVIHNPFEYFWEGSIHYYFPDFYLEEYDLYLEVKGYERDRDKEKWKSVENLVIIKKDEIERIRRSTYRIPL